MKRPIYRIASIVLNILQYPMRSWQFYTSALIGLSKFFKTHRPPVNPFASLRQIRISLVQDMKLWQHPQLIQSP